MHNAPGGWIRQIEASILESKQLPMWGSFPGFPWEEFSNALANHFDLKELKLNRGKAEWRMESETFSGMGSSPLQLNIEMTPLKGSFSLIFPLEDFQKLSSWMIDPKAGKEEFSDPFLQKGFFRYLAVETLHLMDTMHIFKKIRPKLVDMPLSGEKAYCIDIALEKEKESVWGRVVCPPLFHKAFQDHYTGECSLSDWAPLYQEIDVQVSITAGRVSLNQQSWNALSKGDFLILDYCSFSPALQRGTFQLKINNAPLFQIKLKEDRIKILDYALYYEESQMNDETSQEIGQEPLRKGETPPLEPPQEGDDLPLGQADGKEVIEPSQVPIHLSIEVASMKINLDQLLKLKPGNVLETSVTAQQSVNLIANGKCMAKGHLIQIGDVIGVKITQIGHT